MRQAANKPAPTKRPAQWGTSTTAFYAELEGEPIRVQLITGEVITGRLSGLDRYDVFIEQADGNEALISKGAIAWVRRAA